MMILLTPDQYQNASALLFAFKFEPLMQCMIEEIIPGYIYLNGLENPEIAYAQFRHRGYICGNIAALDQSAFLEFIHDVVLVNCQKANVPLLRLTSDESRYVALLASSLESLSPEIVDYQTYVYHLENAPIKEFHLPQSFELRTINRVLLEKEFVGKQALFEEMRVERASPEGFLKHSFGVTAFHDTELAGWCLSEYNHDTRCAVGITTMPSFRRMGIAKSMTLAFLNLAVKQEVETVLWHCYKSNLGSARTAQRAGFHLVDEHQVINISL